MSAWRPEWDEAAKDSERKVSLQLPTVPLWTKRLLIANVLVWALVAVLEGDGSAITSALSVNSGWWWTSAPFLPVWQPLTYAFLHADLGHLVFNCVTLFFIGGMVERALGGRRFLWLYFAAAVFGGLVHAVLGLFPLFAGPMVGASGAVMGLLLASAFLFPRAKLLFPPIPLRWFVAFVVFFSLVSFGGRGDDVAHHVHLAGALVGFLFVKQGWHRRELPSPVEVLAAKQEQRKQATRQQDDARMDELLARISKEGMGSLSQAEKDFLKRMSKRP